MKQRTPIKRTAPPKRVNVKRKRSEFARCYHSKERVEWVKAQPCAWCVLRGRVRMCGRPSDNAHTESYAGMGRKGGYDTIVPLGRYHHVLYDNYAEPFDRPSTRLAMTILAERVEQRWQEHKQQEAVA